MGLHFAAKRNALEGASCPQRCRAQALLGRAVAPCGLPCEGLDAALAQAVPGCTAPSATNFNPEANVYDGSCEFEREGCTDSSALNYDPLAVVRRPPRHHRPPIARLPSNPHSPTLSG